MKKIDAIEIVHEVDTDPDLSYLGEYSDEWREGAIDRHPDDRYGRYATFQGYRYFIPAMTGEETGNPDSPRQDFERAEAYNRGDWGYVGIYARARILTGIVRGGYASAQTVRTPGLWGIESDSDEDYFAEIAKQELTDLGAILVELGFDQASIDAAINSTDLEGVAV